MQDRKTRSVISDVQENIIESDVIENLFDTYGGVDAKYNACVSVPAHLYNTSLIGLNTYLFDSIILDIIDFDEHTAKLLFAAGVLHDLNKVTEQDELSEDALDEYLSEDPLGIKDFFDSFDSDIREELLFIIQRSEETTDAGESIGIPTKRARQVSRYCQLGDKVSSSVSCDSWEGGISKFEQHYSNIQGNFVQTIEWNIPMQPMMASLTQMAVEEFLIENNYLIVMKSRGKVAVLSETTFSMDSNIDEIADKINRKVEQVYRDEIDEGTSYDIGCKVNWQTGEYQQLSEVGFINFEEKRDVLMNEYIEKVLQPASGISERESIDDVDEGFKNYIPELFMHMFVHVDASFYSQEVLVDLFEEICDEHGGHTAQPRMMATLHDEVSNGNSEIVNALDKFQQSAKEELREDLSVDKTIGDRIIDEYFKLENTSTVSASGEMCFLCGSHSTTNYQPGNNAVFSSRSFSKRQTFNQTEKQVCGLCSFEIGLEKKLFDVSNINYEGAGMVFFAVDDFVAGSQLSRDGSDIFVGSENLPGGVSSPSVSEATDSIGGSLKDVIRSTAVIVPVNLASRGSEIDKRIEIVRSTIGVVKGLGIKAILSSPMSEEFGGFSIAFRDVEPTTLETLLRADEIERYEKLDKPIDILNLLNQADHRDNSISYSSISDLSYENIVSTCYERVKTQQLSDAVEKYYSKKHMKMQNIAESGLELYGKSYGSKHVQTTVFREALDCFLDGLSRGMGREELLEYVSGSVMTKAERQDYSGNVTVEQTREFVQLIYEYLEEEELLSLQELSDTQNKLIDTYYFVYNEELNKVTQNNNSNGENNGDSQ